MNVRLAATGALLAGIGAMYACGDTTSPLATRTAATTTTAANTTNAVPLSGADRVTAADGNHGHKVRVLRWVNRLKRDVSASATIGAQGGAIRIPSVGAVFTVPAGALTAPTKITVRADGGRNVVFEMSPNGLHFATPATLTLDLSFTNAYHKQAWAKLLSGGYIQSPIQIGLDDGVTTYEDMTATVDDAVTTASFPVPHFSVVILASQLGTCCTVVGWGN
jgi:hypothetical protein